jgi:hypothetical protein
MARTLGALLAAGVLAGCVVTDGYYPQRTLGAAPSGPGIGWSGPYGGGPYVGSPYTERTVAAGAEGKPCAEIDPHRQLSPDQPAGGAQRLFSPEISRRTCSPVDRGSAKEQGSAC